MQQLILLPCIVTDRSSATQRGLNAADRVMYIVAYKMRPLLDSDRYPEQKMVGAPPQK